MPSPDESPAMRLSASTRERPWLWLLLAALVVLQFGYPVTLSGTGWTVAYLLAYAAVIVAGVRRADAGRRRRWPVLATSAALVVASTWFAVRQDDAAAQAALLTTIALLQLALIGSLTASLLRPPPGTRTVDLLLVAMCTYLLLGGVFGMAAGLMEMAAPASFTTADPDAGPLIWQDLLYGSYVTLSTLGFGDIVPASPWARSLWSLEAVLASLYLAIVIARLVAIGGPRAWIGRDEDEA